MDSKTVTIFTACGPGFGSGHLQRMLALADSIKDDFKTHIVINCECVIPEHLTPLRIRKIPESTDLIIRDMRDSAAGYIHELQKTAPVLAVDDAGEGRHEADHRIDLLPNLLDDCLYTEGRFLYGYNFIDQINSLTDKEITKDIDFAVYAGSPPRQNVLNILKKIIPENSKTVVLAGGEIYELFTGSRPGYSSAAEVMLRSRFIITHFGLTMYEAHLCGAGIIAFNPSDYHSRLTGLVSESMDITELGEYETLSAHAEQILGEKFHSRAQRTAPDAADIKAAADPGLLVFKKFIKSVI